MKKRTRSNQKQAELFSDPQLIVSSSLFEIPADRILKLETALGELLMDAVSKIEHGKGSNHDV